MALPCACAPQSFLPFVGLSKADDPLDRTAFSIGYCKEAIPNQTDGRLTFFAIVKSYINPNICRQPIELIHDTKIHTVFGEVGLAFVFVVGCASAHLGPHLYTYIKGMCKWPLGALGEGRGGWLMRGVG